MKRKNPVAVLAALITIALFDSTCSAQPQAAQPLQKIDIIRLDPKFDKLVPLNVIVERIVGGRKWVEGPVWNQKEGYLLFSDIPASISSPAATRARLRSKVPSPAPTVWLLTMTAG
jgi:hypothetical protein